MDEESIVLEDEINIEMEESVGWVGGDSAGHYSLYGRDDPNQHTIGAITGLREELDDIERLKTVYSDKMNVANYYEWSDGPHDECGRFVSIVPGTITIKICEGSDIFGVSVGGAGFIGGQNEAAPRNNSYGLIATSGVVAVRCESGIEVGDHVVSNGQGIAKKSESTYGYKVASKAVKDGVEYAVIVLGVHADVTDAIGKDLKVVKKAVQTNEQNVISARNVANQAYNKSLEALKASSVTEEDVKKVLEVVSNSEKNIENMYKDFDSVKDDAAQAKTQASLAATSAESLKNEAVARANEAWAKADKVETNTYSLCAKIDKYSVGKYSQAYGLTFEQAQEILEPGMIYAPTRHIGTEYHTETYERTDNTEMPTYERTFTPEYLYQWGYIADIQGYGWITIDKYFNVVSYDSNIETNQAYKSVYFDFCEPAVSVGEDFGYWYTDGDEIESESGTYEPYTLYKWEYDHWLAVSTLKGNASNRMVSEVYQTTNQITMGVANPRGCIAGIDERLTDTEAKITNTTQWTKGSDEFGNALLYNLATIEQKADDGGSSIALAVADVNGNKVIKGANIVLGQNNEDSCIRLSADCIVLDGETSFVTKTNGETKINGAMIDTGTLRVNAANIDGALTVNNEEGQMIFRAGENSVNIGHFIVGSDDTRSYIYSKNKNKYDARQEGIYLGTDGISIGTDFMVDENGVLKANSGEFGPFELSSMGLFTPSNNYNGVGIIASADIYDIVMYVGSNYADRENAAFKVYNDGSCYLDGWKTMKKDDFVNKWHTVELQNDEFVQKSNCIFFSEHIANIPNSTLDALGIPHTDQSSSEDIRVETYITNTGVTVKLYGKKKGEYTEFLGTSSKQWLHLCFNI